MKAIHLLFGFLIFVNWNPEIYGLPLTELRGPRNYKNKPGNEQQIQMEFDGQRSRQFELGNDEEEDEEDEDTTVKGPGHEGILTGLSGIFSGIVSGNANSVVESSFNFVPPVYQKEVNNFYSGIIGRTTTDPPTTTPSKPPPPAARVTNSPLHQESGLEESDAGENETPPPPSLPRKPAPRPVKPSATGGIRTRPLPVPATAPPVVFRPWGSSGDDEEDVKSGI